MYNSETFVNNVRKGLLGENMHTKSSNPEKELLDSLGIYEKSEEYKLLSPTAKKLIDENKVNPSLGLQYQGFNRHALYKHYVLDTIENQGFFNYLNKKKRQTVSKNQLDILETLAVALYHKKQRAFFKLFPNSIDYDPNWCKKNNIYK